MLRLFEVLKANLFKSPTGLWFKSSSASSEPEAKRDENAVKTIGTYGGKFNCHEALACYMLKVLPEYKDARYVHVCTCMTRCTSSAQSYSRQVSIYNGNHLQENVLWQFYYCTY